MSAKKQTESVSENKFVAASVATLLVQNKQILLGRRYQYRELAGKNQTQNFEGWQCPGGYLRKGETVEQSAKRHCLEKAGIEIVKLSAGPYSNNIFSEQLHTATLYVVARSYQLKNARLFENLEDGWRWFDVDDLPEPLYLPLRLLPLKKWFTDN